MVIEFAGGLCLIAALTLGGLLLQTLWRLRATRLACPGFERERMWRRGPDRGLIECNRAYAFGVDAAREAALAQNLELAATDLWKTVPSDAGPAEAANRRAEHRHVVIDGARRLLEITEMPCH